MSGDPADKSQPRLPSWRPQPSEPASSAAPTSALPVTDDIDEAWAAGESPRSSERAKPPSELPRPVSERRPVSDPPKLASMAPPKPKSERPSVPSERPKLTSERPEVTSRPPSVRVSSTPTPGTVTAVARRSTLLGIAPAPDGSSDSTLTPSMPPPSSPDGGASKFEAAAQLLEQKRASLTPKPPETNADATSAPRTSEITAPRGETAAQAARTAEAPAESGDATPPPTSEVTPSSGRARHSERADAPPKSRRRSAAPPPQRGIGILPLALAAAVFVAMFLVGAMRAIREELSNAKPATTTPSSLVESSPATRPAASPASEPAAAASPVARLEESIPAASAETSAGSSAPAPSAAEAMEGASGEPAHAGNTVPVLVRASVSGARFYRHGKQVGMNSVIVDLAPGEKRAFEVDLPGYVSRKVIVDGSSSEVVVILPRISETPAAAHAAAAPASGATPAVPAESAP